jgi:hypothetical protein
LLIKSLNFLAVQEQMPAYEANLKANSQNCNSYFSNLTCIFRPECV